jgi:hypothetical protein
MDVGESEDYVDAERRKEEEEEDGKESKMAGRQTNKRVCGKPRSKGQ